MSENMIFTPSKDRSRQGHGTRDTGMRMDVGGGGNGWRGGGRKDVVWIGCL